MLQQPIDRESSLNLRWRVLSVCLAVWFTQAAEAQSSRRPIRVAPPNFEDAQFEGIFFENVVSQLKGELPTGTTRVPLAASPATSPPETSADDPQAWHQLISPVALEDLVKGTKLQLDRIVTTPAAFQSGGYAEARREFSLLAVLFAVIEVHPGEVRWQKSAGVAREAFARAAANTKIASPQVFREAQQRLLDLGDLLSGTTLTGDAKSELNFSMLIDRVPLMQLLEWSHRQHVEEYSASEASFKKNQLALRRYAELIAVLGKVAIAEEMPDASDEDYVAFAQEMLSQAQSVVLAVETGDANMARRASGGLGQSCTNCHDNYR